MLNKGMRLEGYVKVLKEDMTVDEENIKEVLVMVSMTNKKIDKLNK